MAEKLVIKEPIFIEDEARPIAVLLPIEIFREWQERLREGAVPSAQGSPAPGSGFLREKAAFERLKPQLMKQYAGKCVAVVGGKVVEIGEDKMEVVRKVREHLGPVPMYVQWVTAAPRRYHLPTRRLVQR